MTILWTKPMLQRFKAAYKEAVDANRKLFKFEGNEYVVMYAKYLIEHLEKQFK